MFVNSLEGDIVALRGWTDHVWVIGEWDVDPGACRPAWPHLHRCPRKGKTSRHLRRACFGTRI